MVLPSILVSLLPTIQLLSAVLSYNDSIHVPAISDAVVPSACLRILVDAALRFKCRINRTYYARLYRIRNPARLSILSAKYASK